MSAKYDLERRIADHFAAEAPNRAPDWVLHRTLASVETTPQRRTVLGRPWRTPSMPSLFAKLGVTAVAIAAIGLVGLALLRPPAVGPAGSASPAPASPSTSPQLSPAPGYSRFTSPLNRISIDYPSGWQVRPATRPWGLDPVGFAASDVDVIYDPESQADLFIGVASAVLGAQSEPPDVTFGLETPSKVCDGANWGGQGDLGGGAGRVTVDGSRGWTGYCTDQRVMSNDYLFVQTATRRYVIFLHVGDESRTPGYNEDWFDALFKTIDLLP